MPYRGLAPVDETVITGKTGCPVVKAIVLKLEHLQTIPGIGHELQYKYGLSFKIYNYLGSFPFVLSPSA